MSKPYQIDHGDLPEDLQSVYQMDAVDAIVEYQSPYADYSVILSEEGRKQAIRVHYLKHLREDWTWVDGTDSGCGFVLLSRSDDQ